jgi:hypothetical protein|tara:strand:- start:306 stop:743 length:438 start_codon:yes stop_codon:yes gene_type:complete
MSKRFETEADLQREEKAIKLWTKSQPEKCYEKLGRYEVDYRVFSQKSNAYAYVEVKGRHKKVDEACPLPIAARKLVKIYDAMNRDVEATKAYIIWACEDGIIVGDVEVLIGKSKVWGRPPREGSSNDKEVMVYYDVQKGLKKTMY